MSAYPSLPLFTDAYIADTAHLTNEEHGAYLRLLMFAWRSPVCGLPDDDAKLARMLGLTPKKWASLKDAVMAFWLLENGVWVQSRLNREREFVREKVEKRRASGKQGGRPKSLESNDTAKANGSFSESKTKAPTPTPTPTPTEEKKEEDNSVPVGTIDSDEKYAFVAGAIKLLPRDFARLERDFPAIQLRSELHSLAEWAGRQENWFFAVTAALAKKSRELDDRRFKTQVEVAAGAQTARTKSFLERGKI